ncbi:hypothetical protein HDV00_010123 [Rhizophlyctis rosea]|nr:hypothetical protein HDV00_010123 [Rhizophlyctis rosea]
MLELLGKTILIFLENFSEQYALPRALAIFFVFLVMTTYAYVFFPFTHRSSSIFRCLSTAQILAFSCFSIAAAARPQHNNILFYVSLGITPLTLIISYIAFKIRWSRAVSKDRLEQALKTVKAEDVEGSTGAALIKALGLCQVYEVSLLSRFAYLEPTEEHIKLVDELFQSAIQYFVPPKRGIYGLWYFYGQFLKTSRHDLTLSMMYFKRAADAQPHLVFEFIIYQAERERREQLMAMERGWGKLDAVDRVEYRQLTRRATAYHRETGKQVSQFWKVVSSGKANATNLTKITSRMERAERGAERYYKQMHARFSHIPKVLDAYIKFLDLTARIGEADQMRRQLRDVMEELDDERPEHGMKNGAGAISGDFGSGSEPESHHPSGGRLKRHGSIAGSVTAGSVAGRSVLSLKTSVMNQSMADALPPVPFRTQKVELARMLSIELITSSIVVYVNRVRVGGTATAYTVKAMTHSRALQLAVARNDSSDAAYRRMLIPVIANIITESMNTLYFEKKGLLTEVFVADHVPIRQFVSPSQWPHWSWTNTSLIESTDDYTRHAEAIASHNNTWWFTQSNYTLQLDSNSSHTYTVPIPDYVFDRSWRYVQDNGGIVAAYLDSMVSTLAEANDKGIQNTYIALGLVYCVALVVLALIAGLIFYPAVKRSVTERKLSIEAFLKIPRDVAVDMYHKTRFPPADPNIDTDKEGEDEEEDFDDSDDDDAEQWNMQFAGAMLGGSANTFKKIMVYYVFALLTLLGFYTVSVVGGVILNVQMAHTGRRCAVAAEVPYIVEGARYIATEAIVQDPGFIAGLPEGGITPQVQVARDRFADYRKALYVGDPAQGLPYRVLSDYERAFVYDDRMRDYLNNSASLDDLSSEVLDDLTTIINDPTQLTWTNPAYLRLSAQILNVANEFGYFADYLQTTFSDQQAQLSLFSTKIMFPLFLLWLIRLYLQTLKRILKMIVEENERSVRYLMMLPPHIVGQIETVRELFHVEELDDFITGPETGEGGKESGTGGTAASVEVPIMSLISGVKPAIDDDLEEARDSADMVDRPDVGSDSDDDVYPHLKFTGSPEPEMESKGSEGDLVSTLPRHKKPENGHSGRSSVASTNKRIARSQELPQENPAPVVRLSAIRKHPHLAGRRSLNSALENVPSPPSSGRSIVRERSVSFGKRNQPNRIIRSTELSPTDNDFSEEGVDISDSM